MADLMHQHMRDDRRERVLALAPEIEQRSAVEPDHVGHFARVANRAALREAAPAKKTEEVELALGAHLVERLVVREVVDANDQPFAPVAKRLRELCEGRVGQSLDIRERRGAQRAEDGGLACHDTFGAPLQSRMRAASRLSTSLLVRTTSAPRTLPAASGNSTSTRRNVSRGTRVTTASSTTCASTLRVTGP